MTALEAKQLAFEVLGRQAFTPETLVSSIYDAVCMREGESFKVYGDGILVGSSSIGAMEAWENAAKNLPDGFLSRFKESLDLFAFTPTYYTNPEGKNEEEDTSRDYSSHQLSPA